MLETWKKKDNIFVVDRNTYHAHLFFIPYLISRGVDEYVFCKKVPIRSLCYISKEQLKTNVGVYENFLLLNRLLRDLMAETICSRTDGIHHMEISTTRPEKKMSTERKKNVSSIWKSKLITLGQDNCDYVNFG